MKCSIKTKNNISSLEVEDSGVICILTLATTHDIITKGLDSNGLALKLSRSYRNCFGHGKIGIEFLKLIKTDIVMESKKVVKID